MQDHLAITEIFKVVHFVLLGGIGFMPVSPGA